MFLRFANFYRQFIQRFSWIAAPLTLILKTLSIELAKSKNDRVGVGGDSRVGRNGSEIDESRMNNVEVDGGEVRDNKVRKKGRKTFKSKNLSKFKKTVESDVFTPGARLAFTKLRQAFVKAPILHHFDLERHIRIKTDISGYAISRVLSQLTLVRPMTSGDFFFL